MPYDSETKAMSEPEKPTRSQKAGVSALCIGAFLVLYFLMSGPFVWIEDKMDFEPFTKSVHVVYAPLVLVAKSDMKPASNIIKSYIQLFKD
ncbi:MAG: hypothetical protein QM501_12015 [Gimesia sp.]